LQHGFASKIDQDRLLFLLPAPEGNACGVWHGTG
jgi:hypothetical protein